jgi:hypothetical protein
MGDTYTRQSTYTDGDVITAGHTNDEFNQIVAAFAATSGHSHDGTAGEGGIIANLLSNTITIGTGADTDIALTFNANTADGVLTWMEDEDYFQFSDDILLTTTEKLQFRDTAIYINSSTDGQLDLVADTEIQIAATTIDINGLVDISGNLSVGGNLDVTGTFDLSDSNFTNAGDIQLDSISGDGDTNTSITFSGSDVITVANAGTNQVTFNDGSISPVTDSDVDLGTTSLRFKDVYVDSITATDQITATGFTGTLDGILGSGSAAAASVTTLAASGAITGSSTVQGTTVTATTAFVPGTSDGATHNDGILLNSTRQLQFGDSGTYIHQSADGVLDLVSDTEIEINATTIDINGAVDMSSTLAVAGVLTGASLDISGDVDVDGTTNLDIVDIDGAVNIAADTTIASTNKIIFNDASQFIHAPSTTVLDIAATDEIELTATLVDVVGNFTNSGTIVSAGVVTANAGVVVDEMTLDADTLTATDDFIIDAAGNIEINADGGTITFKDASSTLGTVTSSGFSGTTAVATTVVVTDSTANTNFPVVFNNESNGLLDDTSAFIYNPSSGTLSVANLVVSGDTTTNSSTNLTIADPLVKYGQGSTGTSVDQGFIVTRGDGSSSNTANRGFIWDESADEFATIAANTEAGTTAGNVTINDYAPLHVGAITADDASTFTAGASFGDANITNVGNIALDSITADGSTITITGNTTFADGSFDFDIASHDTSNGLKLGGTLVSATAAELNKLDGVTATTAELNILAGVNTTAAELNKLDGGTSATSTTIVDADRVVLNDNGTIVQVAVSDIKTYIGAATADDATALAIALG